MVNVFAREGAKVVVSDIAQREKEGLQAVSELDAQYGPVRPPGDTFQFVRI